jgi:putative membrane protein
MTMTILPRAMLASALLLGVSGAALAAGNTGSSFLKEAIRGDIAETQIGQLAQQKSTNAEVKSFGQELVTDHGQAKVEATTLAQSMKITVPTKPPRKAQTEYDKLSKLSGPAFDQEFVSYMVKDHQEDISKFQKEAQANDGQVSALAQKTVPVLQKHLQAAQALQSKVGQQQSAQ